MAILVTGGLGFIGAHTTKALLDAGQDCVVTAHHNLDVPGFLTTAVERVDLADREALLKIGERHDIDGIVHLAGRKLTSSDVADEIGANVTLLVNVLAAAKQWGTGRVTVASSVGVYIGASPGTLHEADQLPMTGTFGIEASKKCYEIIGTAAAERDGTDVIFARIGAIWGPLGNPDSPFFPAPAMVHAAARNEPVDLTRFHEDDGVDMLYAPDCGRALALLHAAPALNHRVYNVGSGRAVLNKETAAASTARATLSPGHGPNGTYVLDPTRLTEDTGFHPRFDLHQATENYMEWLHSGHER